MGVPDLIERWHRVAKHGELALLDELLADDVVFHSPVVHTPQKGKALTKLYLSAAFGVFSSKGEGESAKSSERSEKKKPSPFRYVREIYGERDAMLEFVTEIDGIVINGVDIISLERREPDHRLQGDGASAQGDQSAARPDGPHARAAEAELDHSVAKDRSGCREPQPARRWRSRTGCPTSRSAT